MINKYNGRYWIFAARSAHTKGGMRDFVYAAETLTLGIRFLLDTYSGNYSWFQIYDCDTHVIYDSNDVFMERDMPHIKLEQLE